MAEQESDITTYRSSPERMLSYEQAKKMLREKGFFDIAKNKSGKGLKHQYEPRTIDGDKIVIDHATGLTWQQSLSDIKFPSFEKALNYIAELNTKQFAGYSDWRLPTLEEAMTLMEPDRRRFRKYSRECIDPVFNVRRDWMLTSDAESGSYGWFVAFHFGGCDIVDLEEVVPDVLAVRSGTIE